MTERDADAGSWAERHKRNTIRLGYWTGAWVLTLAIATFGPLLVWAKEPGLTLAAILVNLVAGAGMIVANKNHLKGLDEMHQRIHLEAMALALGVALVAGLAYATADVTDLIPVDAEISFLVFLISAAYGIGIYAGRRRYQ